MRSWLTLLAGPLIWTVHFFLLYGIGEFMGSGSTARTLVGVLTFCGLALVALLFRRVARVVNADDFGAWRRWLSLAGLGLAGLAIFWQGLPALLS